MEDAFWCHPFQRQEGLWKIGKHCSNVLISSFICVSGTIFAIDRGNTYAAFRDVVGVVHDVSGQAKVTDLHKFALTDQHISCRKVSMDALPETQLNIVSTPETSCRSSSKAKVMVELFGLHGMIS